MRDTRELMDLAERANVSTADKQVVVALNTASGLLEVAQTAIENDRRGPSVHSDVPETLQRLAGEIAGLRDSYILLWED